MAWKHPNDMTVEECRNEVYSLESYFESCRRSQHGVSSKETVRHRLCQFKVKYFDDLGRTMKLGEDIQAFMDNGHVMFAPLDCGCYVCKRYLANKKAKEAV
jgi:hypothetical protein